MNKLVIRFFFTVLFLSFLANAAAQRTTEGRNLRFLITDSVTHRPLGGVSCRVLSAGGRLRKFGVSTATGHLNLSVTDTDVLEFSCIGYARRRISAIKLSPDTENRVELSATDVVLREVHVNIPPIHAHGDTLVYNVAAFRTAGDRHLEDILRKLPGVKVGENGSVSVQGQPINKFYIEGMDLLGNSYNEATRNMPVDAVKSVEVLENHQPVKMLQNKAFSDKAALNVKLDTAHKARPFGEIEAGADPELSRWDARLFLTQIMKKNQLLLSAKTNNTGTDLSSETEEHIDVNDLDYFLPVPPQILNSAINGEVLPKNRYVQNRSISAGINYLSQLTGKSTIRSNIQLYEDNSSVNSYFDYLYGGERPVRLMEYRSVKRNTLTLLPVLKYEMNAQRAFISDELRYSFNRISNLSTIGTKDASLRERIHTHPDYVRNYFNSSFFIGGNVVKIKSLVRYFDRRDGLEVQSDQSYYDENERLAIRSLTTRNTLSTSFQFLGNLLDLGLRAFYSKNSFYDNGVLNYNKLSFAFHPSYSIRYGTDSNIDLSLPVIWTNAGLVLRTGDKRNRHFMSFSPRLNVYHQFSYRFRLNLLASMNTDDSPGPFYATDTVRTGYRTLFVPANVIFKNTTRRISLRLRYRDYVSLFFATLAASYSDTRRESYSDYRYSGSFSTSTVMAGRNHQRMLMVNAEADKSFSPVGLSFKSEISYGLNSFLLSQNAVMTENKSNTVSIALSSIFQKLKWLKLMIGARGNLYWERSHVSHSDVLSSLSTTVTTRIFPVKNLEIRLNLENLTNEVAASHYKNTAFLDGSLRYTINKTWDVSLTATNVFNMRSYTVVINSGLNTSTSMLALTGRRILLHLQFRF